MTYLYNKIHPYSSKVQDRKRIHVIIQADKEVSDSVFGDVVVTLIKMLMRTKNKVISKVMRPVKLVVVVDQVHKSTVWYF